MSNDLSYYAARAVEERRMAMTAADDKVRRVHLEMAAEYAALAGAHPSIDGIPPEAEQQSA